MYDSRGRRPAAGRLLRKLVDLLRGSLEDLAHLGQNIALGGATKCAAVHDAPEVGEGAVDVHHLAAKEAGAKLRHPLEDVVDGRLMLGQVGTSGLGDLVDLLAAFLLTRHRESKVDEHGESGVDRAGTGRVRAREALLELLDDLVAVARLLFQQLQNDVLEIALLEHAAAAPRAAPPAPWASPETEDAGVEAE